MIRDTYYQVYMKRDISVMVFKNKNTNDGYVCRACYNTQNEDHLIRSCAGIFIRTCDQYGNIPFNNKKHDIVLSTDGFCNIKLYNRTNGNCLTNENCIDCTTKNEAIRSYKQNNNLQ